MAGLAAGPASPAAARPGPPALPAGRLRGLARRAAPPLPPPLGPLPSRLADLAGWLGWRPPIRTTARREIVRGAVGDPSEWIRLTGIEPRSLLEGLRSEPAT